MEPDATLLIFGATGRTGQHLTALALQNGHRVKALVRTPSKLRVTHPSLEVHQGSIADLDDRAHPVDLDALLDGVDAVVVVLGEAQTQQTSKVNLAFVEQLVPRMRHHRVRRLVYQAGALSRPPGRRLSPALWLMRHTIARSFTGQHQDNEAVMQYLTREADDIDWVVHRASIGSDKTSRRTLERARTRLSIATFQECASYDYRLLFDTAAIHTCDTSTYTKPGPQVRSP